MATTSAPKPPPDPRPEMLRARAQLEADVRAAQDARQLRTLELAQALQRGRAEADLAARRDTELATSEHVARLAELSGEQRDYTPTGGTQGPTSPPPMLPSVNVDPMQPTRSVPGDGDRARQFAGVLEGSGADPALARGGAGVQQVLGQGQAGAGPPLIPMPGMAPPTPAPGGPQLGNPSVTLGNGETYSAPAFIPETTATLKAGWDNSTGQRLPITETGVTSTMRPNVLTPGDILVARQRQDALQWQKTVDQMQLSMQQAKYRQDVQVQLMEQIDPRHVGPVQELLNRGDYEGANRYLQANHVRTKFDATQTLINAQIIHARASAAEARATITVRQAEARRLDQQTTQEREEHEYQQRLRAGLLDELGMGGGGGGTAPGAPGPASPSSGPGADPSRIVDPHTAYPTSRNTPLSSLYGGTTPSRFHTLDSKGNPTIDFSAPAELQRKIAEAAAKVYEGNPKDQATGAVATRLAGLTALGLQGEMIPTRSTGGTVAGTDIFGVYTTAGTPGESVIMRPLSTVMLISSLAFHDPHDATGLWSGGGAIPDAVHKAAQQTLINWGLAEEDPQTHRLIPVQTGNWQAPSRTMFLGAENAERAGVTENEWRMRKARGTLDPEVLGVLRGTPAVAPGAPSFGTPAVGPVSGTGTGTPAEYHASRQAEAIAVYDQLQQLNRDLSDMRYRGLTDADPAVREAQTQIADLMRRARDLPEINTAVLSRAVEPVARVAGAVGRVAGELGATVATDAVQKGGEVVRAGKAVVRAVPDALRAQKAQTDARIQELRDAAVVRGTSRGPRPTTP